MTGNYSPGTIARNYSPGTMGRNYSPVTMATVPSIIASLAILPVKRLPATLPRTKILTAPLSVSIIIFAAYSSTPILPVFKPNRKQIRQGTGVCLISNA